MRQRKLRRTRNGTRSFSKVILEAVRVQVRLCDRYPVSKNVHEVRTDAEQIKERKVRGTKGEGGEGYSANRVNTEQKNWLKQGESDQRGMDRPSCNPLSTAEVNTSH